MYEISEFEEWEATVPEAVRSDPLWRMRAYRLSLFCAGRVVGDAQLIDRAPRMGDAADQLVRAVRSVGAQIAEGYSRASGADRARLFGYALGSAREARHWYRTVNHLEDARRFEPAVAALDQVRRLLMAIIPKERERRTT